MKTQKAIRKKERKENHAICIRGVIINCCKSTLRFKNIFLINGFLFVLIYID